MNNNRTEQSVLTGVKIIKKAIKQDLSLTKAAKLSSLGKNYVSDIKLRLSENLDKNNIDKKTYNEFVSLLKRMDKIKKTYKKLNDLKKV